MGGTYGHQGIRPRTLGLLPRTAFQQFVGFLHAALYYDADGSDTAAELARLREQYPPACSAAEVFGVTALGLYPVLRGEDSSWRGFQELRDGTEKVLGQDRAAQELLFHSLAFRLCGWAKFFRKHSIGSPVRIWSTWGCWNGL